MHRGRRSPPHLGRGHRPHPPARRGAGRGRHRSARRRRRPGDAGTVGVAPRSRRPLPPQRPRVPRGHAGRLEGPGRRRQRQLPLRRLRAALRAGRQRGPGRDLPRRVRRHPRRGAPRAPGGRAAAPGRRRHRAPTCCRAPCATRTPWPRPRPSSPVDLSPDDRYILYTGGTTGMPKGTLWRQGDFLAAALGVTAPLDEIVADAQARAGLRTLPSAPFMHGAAHWNALSAWTSGGTVVVQDDPTRLDPADVLATCARERVSALQIVGDPFARPLLDELEQARLRPVRPAVPALGRRRPVGAGEGPPGRRAPRPPHRRRARLVRDRAAGGGGSADRLPARAVDGRAGGRPHPPPGPRGRRDRLARPVGPGAARVPGRRGQVTGDVPRRRRRAPRGGRRPGAPAGRRVDRAAGPRLGHDQHRRREGVRRGGRAGAHRPPGRGRRGGRRPAQRAVGIRDRGGAVGPAGRRRRRTTTSCAPTAGAPSPATRCPRRSAGSTGSSAPPPASPTTPGPATWPRERRPGTQSPNSSVV